MLPAGALKLLMPSGALGRHQVLIFHRVLNHPDPMMPTEPTVGWFDRTVAQLSRHFNILSLGEAVERMTRGSLPRGSVSITFDDGYADNFLNALPVLEKYSAPATFFIATDYLDGGRMWNDTIIETARRLVPGDYRLQEIGFSEPGLQSWHIETDDDRRQLAGEVINACKYLPAPEREARAGAFAGLQDVPLPDDLMMTVPQLRQMDASDYAELGGHTLSHPILANCDREDALGEIDGGARRLQELTGRRPSLFAYPNGKRGTDYLDAQVPLVRQAGFRAAVATDWGVMTSDSDLLQIPRFTPWHQNHTRFLIDLLRARFGLL